MSILIAQEQVETTESTLKTLENMQFSVKFIRDRLEEGGNEYISSGDLRVRLEVLKTRIGWLIEDVVALEEELNSGN